MLHISILQKISKLNCYSAITPISFRKIGELQRISLLTFFPLFFLFCLFVFSCNTHSVSLSSVSVTLFYSGKKSNKEHLVKHSHKQTKNLIWLFKKLGRYERASFCVSSALFIYLKGCTLYQFTLPHSLRHRLEGSEVKRINYFFIIIYKVIYL